MEALKFHRETEKEYNERHLREAEDVDQLFYQAYSSLGQEVTGEGFSKLSQAIDARVDTAVNRAHRITRVTLFGRVFEF